jgi:hypothetical protein
MRQLKPTLFAQRSKAVNARMGTESRVYGRYGNWYRRGEKSDMARLQGLD